MDLTAKTKEVQDAWNRAVSTKDAKDIEYFERLEDEYYILLNNARHNKLRNYRNNIASGDD